jgi:hypothetical protein
MAYVTDDDCFSGVRDLHFYGLASGEIRQGSFDASGYTYEWALSCTLSATGLGVCTESWPPECGSNCYKCQYTIRLEMTVHSDDDCNGQTIINSCIVTIERPDEQDCQHLDCKLSYPDPGQEYKTCQHFAVAMRIWLE